MAADKSLNVALLKSGGHWQIGDPAGRCTPQEAGHAGPIDDAFVDSFIFVKATGQPLNDVVGKWTSSEADRAIKQWHGIFRGEPPVKNDTEITDADIASNNLVLFGDPSSNAVIKRVADRLGIQSTAQSVTAGKQTFTADTHVPVFIYPNPLNSTLCCCEQRIHVPRSQQQRPPESKLPDWAVVNAAGPGVPDAGVVHMPAAIKAAGFFDEAWKVKNEN